MRNGQVSNSLTVWFDCLVCLFDRFLNLDSEASGVRRRLRRSERRSNTKGCRFGWGTTAVPFQRCVPSCPEVRTENRLSKSVFLFELKCCLQVRANDLRRIGEEIKVPDSKSTNSVGKSKKSHHVESHFGWLCKAGLNNTQLQRRWCAIYRLKLYYFEGPRVRFSALSLPFLISLQSTPLTLSCANCEMSAVRRTQWSCQSQGSDDHGEQTYSSGL